MTYLEFIGKEQLKQSEDQIIDLFRLSFGRDFNRQMWNWAYFQNPAGDPAISLYYENDKLLGYYAAVPINLLFRGKQITGYRSMTTMVHPDARGKGLFVELARRCFSMLQEASIPLIFGFPNDQSTPGFVKHLGWTVLPSDLIVHVLGATIKRDSRLRSAITKHGDIVWNFDDEMQMKWRTSAPSVSFKVAPGLIMKKHNNTWNILHLSENGVDHLDPEAVYRVSVDSDFRDLAPSDENAFNYRFGFRMLDDCFGDATFKRDLILSDVF